MKKLIISFLIIYSSFTFSKTVKFINKSYKQILMVLSLERDNLVEHILRNMVNEVEMGEHNLNYVLLSSGQRLDTVCMPDGSYVSLTACANSGDIIEIHIDIKTDEASLHWYADEKLNKEWIEWMSKKIKS